MAVAKKSRKFDGIVLSFYVRKGTGLVRLNDGRLYNLYSALAPLGEAPPRAGDGVRVKLRERDGEVHALALDVMERSATRRRNRQPNRAEVISSHAAHLKQIIDGQCR